MKLLLSLYRSPSSCREREKSKRRRTTQLMERKERERGDDSKGQARMGNTKGGVHFLLGQFYSLRAYTVKKRVIGDEK